MKMMIALVLLIGLSAHAAPPPISPLLPIPNFSPQAKSETLTVGLETLKRALVQYGIDPTKLTKAELQCLAATFVLAAARTAQVFDVLAAAKMEAPIMPQDAEAMKEGLAYLENLQDQWCNGQGGKTVRVNDVIERFRKENTKGTAKSFGDSIRALNAKQAWSARDWTIVAMAIAAALALEVVPVP